MAEFAPILLLLFIWIIVGLPVTIAKKAANQKKTTRTAGPAAPAEGESSSAPAPAVPDRLRPLAPTVTEPDHDDSVFTGSLGAFSTEGYDPCHDEQMQSLEAVCRPGREQEHPTPQASSGLPLGWTGSDMVRGVVMSEILNRKQFTR